MKIKLTISRDDLKAGNFKGRSVTKTGTLPEERSTEALGEIIKTVKNA